jgi:hypothetical protein
VYRRRDLSENRKSNLKLESNSKIESKKKIIYHEEDLSAYLVVDK